MEEYSIQNFKEDKNLFYSYIRNNCRYNKLILNNLDEVRDICLYRLYKSRQTYDKEKGCYSTYAYRMIKYTILYYYHKSKYSVDNSTLSLDAEILDTPFIDFLASNENTENNFVCKSVMQKFWNLLRTNKKLNKPKIKIVAYLYFWKGYQYTEIANVLKCTRQAVEQKLKYIIKLTKDKFTLDDFTA